MKAGLFFCLLCLHVWTVTAQLSGGYTINPYGSGVRNYPSFGTAVKALSASGISGNVTFTVANGVYTETFVISGPIPGAGPGAWVTFRSASDDPGACVIRHNGIGLPACNGTVNFTGTGYITFRGIGISNYRQSNAMGVHIQAGKTASRHLKFERCHFLLDTTSPSYAQQYGVAVFNGSLLANTGATPVAAGHCLTFRDCLFKGGTTGLGAGCGQYEPYGCLSDSVIVDSCTFVQQIGRGMVLLNYRYVTISRNMIYEMRDTPTINRVTKWVPGPVGILLYYTTDYDISTNYIHGGRLAIWIEQNTSAYPTNLSSMSQIVNNYFLAGSVRGIMYKKGYVAYFLYIRNVSITNNTFKSIMPGHAGVSFNRFNSENNGRVDFVNNVIDVGEGAEYAFGAPENYSGVIDNNVYYGGAGATGRFFFGNYYASLEEWRRAFPAYNTHSVYDTISLTYQIINSLEVKNRLTQKEKDLVQQQLLLARRENQIREKNFWIWGICLSFLLLAVFFIHVYRSNAQKARIRQLKATMKGEEKERERIARDLHDGIVGQLAAIRMNFNVVRKQYPELARSSDFRDALSQLDETAGEIRKTAHNLMPEILLEKGLAEAVHIYCEKMGRSGAPHITFQLYSALPRLNPDLELAIYRMVQELVQNIIKHAGATQALVQLGCHNDLLSVTVEDNGRGIPGKKLRADMGGRGLHTIRTRVAALNGSFDIQSLKGTTVYLEFDIRGPAA